MISDEAWGPDGDLPIRRPHWDDDVIKAVADVLEHDDYIYATTYAVIAAVEDWHEKFVMHGAFRVLAERAANAEAARDRLANQLLNEVPDSYIQMKARALDAEAAIARVRDMCDDFEHEENLNGGIGRYAVVRVDRVRSALNGDSDERRH